MGFTSGQFHSGERVQVREDTRHPNYITFAGMTGVVADINSEFRTWHASHVSYDYAYKVHFDAPKGEELSDIQRQNLTRLAEQTWIPGRYLEPATTTMFIRKTDGRWRDIEDLPERCRPAGDGG